MYFDSQQYCLSLVLFSCSFSFAVHLFFSLILVHFQMYDVLYGFSNKDIVSCIIIIINRTAFFCILQNKDRQKEKKRYRKCVLETQGIENYLYVRKRKYVYHQENMSV